MDLNTAIRLFKILSPLLVSVLSISNINMQPLSVPNNGCIREATINMQATRLWTAGTYDLFACGPSANLSQSPLRFCTLIDTVNYPQNVTIRSCRA